MKFHPVQIEPEEIEEREATKKQLETLKEEHLYEEGTPESCFYCHFRGRDAFDVPYGYRQGEIIEIASEKTHPVFFGFECRRYPPKDLLDRIESSPPITLFPVVRALDWCGEFKPVTGPDTRSLS